MNIINVKCEQTNLTAEGFTIFCVGDGTTQVQFSKPISELSAFLTGINARFWEELRGTYFRIAFETQEDGSAKLIKVGNIISENWYDVDPAEPQPEEE